MKYLLRYTMSEPVDTAALQAAFPEHRAAWSRYREAGSLLAIGPMESPADGALAVFTNREDAERFAAADPFVTQGLVATWTVAAWREVLLPE